MNKEQALKMLGGNPSKAARKIGISATAVCRWPKVLTPAIRDRVQAVLYRDLVGSSLDQHMNLIASSCLGMLKIRSLKTGEWLLEGINNQGEPFFYHTPNDGILHKMMPILLENIDHKPDPGRIDKDPPDSHPT